MVAVALLDPPSVPIACLPSERSRPGHLPSGACAVAGLAEPDCRWPLGELAQEDFRFCGAPRSRGSYCPVHRRLAYAGAGR